VLGGEGRKGKVQDGGSVQLYKQDGSKHVRFRLYGCNKVRYANPTALFFLPPLWPWYNSKWPVHGPCRRCALTFWAQVAQGSGGGGGRRGAGGDSGNSHSFPTLASIRKLLCPHAHAATPTHATPFTHQPKHRPTQITARPPAHPSKIQVHNVCLRATCSYHCPHLELYGTG